MYHHPQNRSKLKYIMKYTLYPNSLNDLQRARETVFQNRNYQYPVGGFDKNVSDWSALEDIQKAVDAFAACLSDPAIPIELIVDCDFDGYASASILYRYIEDVFPYAKIRFHLHDGKKHGLSDDIPWMSFSKSLVLIPDAGSNDVEQCKRLVAQGCTVIVLDHHEVEEENPYAIVVNCKRGAYPNPSLCGTGVTWQFIRALDEHYWTELADTFLDIVATATVADIMDVTIPENRILIDSGLSEACHPLLRALADKSNKSFAGITGIDIQFGIAPLVNAMVRVGGSDEKELMFKAFCCELEFFDYKKRGSDEVIEESIYDRVARLCYNAKNRQKKSSKEDVDSLIEQIKENNLDRFKALVVNGSFIDPAFTGILAAKLSDMYKRPCLVIRAKNAGLFGGSGRNNNVAAIESFKKVLEDTGKFEMVAGHANAFGFEISQENITPMLRQLEETLPYPDDAAICADFIVQESDLNFDTVALFAKQILPYCGEGFDNPIVVVENILVRRDQVSTMGNGTSWKVITDDDVEIVKFGVPASDCVVNWYNETDDDCFRMTIAGTIGLNQWAGLIKGQVIVKEYEMWRDL